MIRTLVTLILVSCMAVVLASCDGCEVMDQNGIWHQRYGAQCVPGPRR